MRFEPDPVGMDAIRVEAAASTVPRLTQAIYEDSRRMVPILSGDLRASGRTEYSGSTGYVVYGDDEGVDYAAYQEVGTSVMDPQPYLRPAAYTVREL